MYILTFKAVQPLRQYLPPMGDVLSNTGCARKPKRNFGVSTLFYIKIFTTFASLYAKKQIIDY